MTKQPVDQGKFNTTANIMFYGGLTLVISGFTSSLVVLYLSRNLNPCKKIHFDPILNKQQNIIRKSTKENKILEIKLIEKSLANKTLQHKLIELKKRQNKSTELPKKSFSEYNFAGFGFDFGYILISRHR